MSGVESAAAVVHEISLRPWSRRDVVALGLCCGTDLDDGVPKAGPAAAMALLEACSGGDGSTDALDALRAFRDGGSASADSVSSAGGVRRIAAHCRAASWPPESIVQTYLAPPARDLLNRRYEWRRPSAVALRFVDARACVSGHFSHTSIKYVLARIKALLSRDFE